MWSWYDDPEGDRLRMLLAALVGALVMGLVWLAQWGLTRDSEPSQSETAVQQSSESELPAASGAPDDSGAATQLERCQEVHEAQDEPLQAAAASLEQWEVHVGAMNKLVVGAITLKQAWQFWNQTRVGASHRLHAFTTADQRFDQRTARCPDPTGSPEVTTGLSNCHRAVVARNRTLRLATVSLRTWEEHVHHMNMLRSGDMTPKEATQLWLQNWQQGDRELRAYQAAARAAEGPAC